MKNSYSTASLLIHRFALGYLGEPGQPVPGDVSGLQLRAEDPAGIHDADADVLGLCGSGWVDHLVLL